MPGIQNIGCRFLISFFHSPMRQLHHLEVMAGLWRLACFFWFFSWVEYPLTIRQHTNGK